MAHAGNHIVGYNGAVSGNTGWNMAVVSFQATIHVTPSDTTEIGDGWSYSDPAHFSISGVVVGKLRYNAATTAPIPASIMATSPTLSAAQVTLTLTLDTGCTWSGPATIVALDLGRDNIEGTVAFSFIGNGSWGQTWDETA
jgi:hypothetical protein